MPAFQFLPFKDLGDKLVKLFEDEYQKYADLKQEVPAKREAQMQELSDLYEHLRTMTSATDSQRLLKDNSSKLDEYYRRLNELDELAELSAEQKKEKDELTAKKDALLRFDIELRKTRHDDLAVEQALRIMSDEQKAKVMVGALLVLKQKIKAEYEQGLANAFINLAAYMRLVKENKPENSRLYTGIPAAIGMSDENVLDEASEKEALAAYNQFVGVMKDLGNKVKPAAVDAGVDASHLDTTKLKKAATVEKQAKLVMKDLTVVPVEPELAPSKETNSSAKIKAMMAAREYTPELIRSFDAARLNHVVPNEQVPQLGVVREPTEQESVRVQVKEAEAGKKASPHRAKWRENDEGEWVNHSHHKQFDVKYHEEDTAKVKAAWKGVKEPHIREMTEVMFHRDVKNDLTGFNKRKLKHVEPNVKSDVAVVADDNGPQIRHGM
ncbi:hypothetical protein AQUSIP_25350 [Aquicella siphonis]|uniref:Uncharacterized protein n=1 Tax=Aquicella siphonis TaxID=254247 RepID=A0A5E4PKX8_9COXI|nr:hypothetical protein [Aquicella siphonis]VVC77208.1 hypothetical protein AQUSIP_25350 [Aquicella siphonis]